MYAIIPKIPNFANFELQASLLERLKAGEVILGDGSYTVTLEKRGYVLANAWTPESSVEHPEAVRHSIYIRTVIS